MGTTRNQNWGTTFDKKKKKKGPLIFTATKRPALALMVWNTSKGLTVSLIRFPSIFITSRTPAFCIPRPHGCYSSVLDWSQSPSLISRNFFFSSVKARKNEGLEPSKTPPSSVNCQTPNQLSASSSQAPLTSPAATPPLSPTSPSLARRVFNRFGGNWKDFTMILAIFAVTGSTSVQIVRPLLETAGIVGKWKYGIQSLFLNGKFT